MVLEEKLLLTDSKQSKSNRLYWYCLVVALVVFVVTTIILSALLVLKTKFNSDKPTGQESTSTDGVCDDIAIIGAGPGGAYAAWRLRGRYLSISVYEYSNRIGGRLYTERLNGISDINIELGGMRFLSSQKLIAQTIRDLGLETETFPVGFELSSVDLAYVRGVRMYYGEMGGSKTPYILQPNERMGPYDLAMQIFLNNTNHHTVADYEDESVYQYLKTSVDGIQLYKQSMDLAMSKMVTEETLSYITDTIQSFRYHKRLIAAYPIPSKYANSELRTITSGYDNIAKALLHQFKNASSLHKVWKNHQLAEITKRKDGVYRLHFIPTLSRSGITSPDTTSPNITRCARNVILTVPRLALTKVKWEGFDGPDVQDFLQNAVIDITAGKLFLAYKNPWWRTKIPVHNQAVSDLPLQNTIDFGTSSASNLSVLLAGYFHLSNVELFEEANQKGKPVPGVQSEDILLRQGAVDLAHRYLSQLIGIDPSNITQPELGALKLWNKFPFGAGWQAWKPGYIPKVVRTRMVSPLTNDSVFIACSAFQSNDLSAWVEGSFMSVEEVLNLSNL